MSQKCVDLNKKEKGRCRRFTRGPETRGGTDGGDTREGGGVSRESCEDSVFFWGLVERPFTPPSQVLCRMADIDYYNPPYVRHQCSVHSVRSCGPRSENQDFG